MGNYLTSWLSRFFSRRDEPPAVQDELAGFSLRVDFIELYGVVKITTQGRLTLEANNQIVGVALAAGKQHNTRLFLVDDRAAELAMNLVSLYDLPAHNEGLGVLRELRVALLFSPTQRNSELFKFYENRIVITSFQQRIFTEEREALSWLLADQSV